MGLDERKIMLKHFSDNDGTAGSDPNKKTRGLEGSDDDDDVYYPRGRRPREDE